MGTHKTDATKNKTYSLYTLIITSTKQLLFLHNQTV